MRRWSLALLAGLLLLVLGAMRLVNDSADESSSASASRQPQASSSSSSPPVKRLTGNLDVTFLVAADTHIGYGVDEDPKRDPLIDPQGIEVTNLRMIRKMNSIADSEYPAALGGRVGAPRGVLIAGDLTEHGGKEQWRLWTRLYGLHGTEGALELPVFEGAGNHDRNKNWHVREQVAKRHGGRFYTLDWGDLRLVCLGEGPDKHGLKHLKEALAGVTREVPLVIYLHYPLTGPYSDNHWFGRGDFRDRLFALLEGYYVLGIFHGHHHATAAYRWRGLDVYNVGSPKYRHHSFAVVEINGSIMKVAAYDYDLQQWIWWHMKPVGKGSKVREVVGVAENLSEEHEPEFTLMPRTAATHE